MNIVSFDYTRQTVTITKQVKNIIYIKTISWEKMQLEALNRRANEA